MSNHGSFPDRLADVVGRLLIVSMCSACPSEVTPRDPAPDPERPITSTDPSKGSAEDPVPSSDRSSPEIAKIRAEGNHLRDEPSPYLRQHAHNPVDWYPWGPEALARARAEGKPIFLSVGYSTCHWCHVMEEESFEDDEVARFLNEHFIAIKVDREQRPDVDAVYIDAVAAMGGSTGWPLTVFLTPTLRPFYGGTYFPRHAEGDRPGFGDVLEQVRQQWTEHGERAADRGERVLEQVERRALAAVGHPSTITAERLSDAIERLARARDLDNGGFGRGRKFPQSPLLLAHLRHVQRSIDSGARAHLLFTLEQMMRGGIRDHLTGSFHRYTVDGRWHLPHFEKTLYDNAQLASLYIDAGLTFERDDLVAVGRAVLDDLVEHWQREDGGLVVGWDADDPLGEGHFYSWTPEELSAVLPPEDASVVARAFGVSAPGLRSLEGRSVLHRQADQTTATALGLEVDALRKILDRSLPLLATARAERPPPRVDGKELTAWNGLAIIALADAARWLDEPRYREAAQRAGAWVLDTAWAGPVLSRGVIDGRTLGAGFLDDHALTGLGLLRLHAATGDLRWLEGARRLADQIVEHFYDADRHAFLHVRADAMGGEASLPVRIANFGDNALPSGGAAAVLLMLELGAISGDPRFDAIGRQVLERTINGAVEEPYSAGTLLVALDHATAPVREVVIAGDDGDATTAALWQTLARTRMSRVLPVRVPAKGLPSEHLASYPALEGKRARRGRATAYVCERGRCLAPTSKPAELRRQLLAAEAELAEPDDAAPESDRK